MTFCSFLLLSVFGLFESPVLVEKGQPVADIVIPANPTLNDEFCAGQLQYWVREVTGAKLPIVKGGLRSCAAADCADAVAQKRNPPDAEARVAPPYQGMVVGRRGPASPLKHHVFLGRALAEKRGTFADDFAFFGATDGYGIRRDGADLYLFGGKPCSTLWAVYEMLERTTGIIWPSMAEGCDRIFDKTDAIVVKEDFREKPYWTERSWSVNNGYYYNHPATEAFCLRNKSDALKGDSARRKAAGLTSDNFECHNIGRYLPWAKYKDAHPEYYCIIDGVRTPPGYSANVCFSSMEGADEYAKNYIRDNIEGQDERTVSGIGIEDANNTCQCANCLKPITPPDGRVLERKGNEKVFDSTRYYLWLNRVCERIAEKHPNHRINTIAYMFTTEPPAVPLAKNLFVNYCPIGKDTRKAFGEKGTENDVRILAGWKRLSPEVGVYEYWGCGAAYPRPVEYVIQKDLKYYGNTQCFRSGTEWIHKNGAEYVSALDFWVTNKLLWDPNRDIEALRKEFCRRAFREGAEELYQFYSVVRDAWFKDKGRSTWSDDPVNATAFLLKSEGERATKAVAAIRTAEGKIANAQARRLVGKIADCMEKLVADAKKRAKAKGDTEIPFVANAADVTSFEGPSWAKAVVFPAADFLDSRTLTNTTSEAFAAKSLSDGKTLWFKLQSAEGALQKGGLRFRAAAKNSLVAQKGGAEDSEESAVAQGSRAERDSRRPRNPPDLAEHWELFLASPTAGNPFYRIAVDPEGTVASFVGGARTQGALACKAQVRPVGTSGWEAIVGVPLEALKLKEDGKMRLTFVHVGDGAKEIFGWHGAFPCNVRHLRPVKVVKEEK